MIVYDKTNIDRTQRNNQVQESKTIVKYVQQVSIGTNGQDAYQAFVSPNNCTFTEGSNQETKLVNVFAFRGSMQLDTSVGAIVCKDASDNTIPSTMLDTSVSYNGTNRTQITITKYGSLDKSEGQIVIPITYNLDMTDSSSNLDSSTWDADYGWSFQTFNVIFSWNKISSGDSVYSLDLSNENASINCDSSGNVLANAHRPSCKATLYFGTQEVTNNIYYDASISPDASVADASWDINHSTGVLTLNQGFNFYPDSSTQGVLPITFTAKVNNVQRGGTKIMNITKSIPGTNGAAGPQGATGPQGQAGKDGTDGTNGTDGADAVSYWIDLSPNAARVDSSGNIIPQFINYSVWEQIGGNEPGPIPVPADDEVVRFSFEIWPNGDAEQPIPLDLYDSSVNINPYRNLQYLDFKFIDNTTMIALDTETVPILRDGKNGTNGTNGRAGAAIRGPIEWDGSLNRRFCSGEEDAVEPDTVDPEDVKWIDIIFRDGHYYRCTTSYYQTPPKTWNEVSSKWTQADAEYEFIATKLLLAEDAKINFLTNNQLYLNDVSGNVTAGASGGSGVSFWAGGTGPNDASNNFTVDYHGNITAKTGRFEGNIITPYIFVAELSYTIPNSGATKYYADERPYLVSDGQNYTRGYSYSELILPTPDASHNGFTYTIIVEPTIETRSSAITGKLVISTTNYSEIYCYAFSELLTDSMATLAGGKYTVTCMKKYYDQSVTYVWAIIEATGAVMLDNKWTTPVVGQSSYEQYMTEKVVAYSSSSSKPGVNRPTNTMFVTYN